MVEEALLRYCPGQERVCPWMKGVLGIGHPTILGEMCVPPFASIAGARRINSFMPSSPSIDSQLGLQRLICRQQSRNETCHCSPGDFLSVTTSLMTQNTTQNHSCNRNQGFELKFAEGNLPTCLSRPLYYSSEVRSAPYHLHLSLSKPKWNHGCPNPQ